MRRYNDCGRKHYYDGGCKHYCDGRRKCYCDGRRKCYSDGGRNVGARSVVTHNAAIRSTLAPNVAVRSTLVCNTATLLYSDGSGRNTAALCCSAQSAVAHQATAALHYNDGRYRSKKKIVFFFGMTPSKFKSLQPPPLRARKIEKESEKEKEKASKPVLVSLFPAPWLSSDPSAVGWQRCNNASSSSKLPLVAPSSSTNNTSNKKKFKNSTLKEICWFQH
jgi:hypothetical protein